MENQEIPLSSINYSSYLTQETGNRIISGSTKQQLLSRYSIKIDFLSRGCVVNIGCKTIPFEKVEDAITEISRYVNNPEEVEKEYNEKFK